MSKASEWAKDLQARVDSGPRFSIENQPRYIAGIHFNPQEIFLQLAGGLLLDPPAALALAEWIIDTFGEIPAPASDQRPGCVECGQPIIVTQSRCAIHAPASADASEAAP